MDIKWIKMTVIFCRRKVKVGNIDIDHFSLILTINDVLDVVDNCCEFDDENFTINVVVSWSNEKLLFENDKDFINFISKSIDKGFDRVLMEMNVLPLKQMPIK